MSYFFIKEGLVFRSYLHGHFRNTLRDQLVVPTSLRKLSLIREMTCQRSEVI